MNRRTLLTNAAVAAGLYALDLLVAENERVRELEPNPDALRIFRGGERIAWADQKPGDRIVAWTWPEGLRYAYTVVAAPTADEVEVEVATYDPDPSLASQKFLWRGEPGYREYRRVAELRRTPHGWGLVIFHVPVMSPIR